MEPPIPGLEFNEQLKILGRYGDIFDGLTGSADRLTAVIGALGPATGALGASLNNMIQETALATMVAGFDAIDKSASAVQESIKRINEAEPGEARQAEFKQLHLALEQSERAAGALKKSIEASLAPLERIKDLIVITKDLRQLDLDISQQLYGTPALAVQAQLELVKTMQMEKENLEAQLATIQSLIAEAKARGETEQDIFAFRMKELDLSKQIKSVTRDQLRQVKELRDGYLDSLSAQALGAGKFSKIIITQEANLMRGLKKGAVKPNFLLGQYGADAGKTRADPYRFSAQEWDSLRPWAVRLCNLRMSPKQSMIV